MLGSTLFQALSIIIPSIAVLLAPIVAFFVIEKVNKKKTHQEQIDECYKELYLFRLAPLSHSFVTAFNSVPLVFCKYKKIMDLWKELLKHLNHSDQNEGWEKKRIQLVSNLISLISNYTSYAYKKVSDNDIQYDGYIPKAYFNNDQHADSVCGSLKVIAENLQKQTEYFRNISTSEISLKK